MTLCVQELVMAATNGGKPIEEQEGALVAILTWLRFSSSRLLTWNKNYNIKPREISAAQVGDHADITARYTNNIISYIHTILTYDSYILLFHSILTKCFYILL